MPGDAICPTAIAPDSDFRGGWRYFRCHRPWTDHKKHSGPRLHAGVDWYLPLGTEIRAICAGTVLRGGPYPFYSGTWAVEVYHPGIGLVRYGEILKPGAKLASMNVTAGTLLGNVAKIGSLHPMMHFEVFSDAARNERTLGPIPGNAFGRAPELLDPTPLAEALLTRLTK